MPLLHKVGHFAQEECRKKAADMAAVGVTADKQEESVFMAERQGRYGQHVAD